MFSNEEPSEAIIQDTKFSILLYGQGWSDKLASNTDEYKTPVDKTLLCKVSGSNPGYGATCTALTLAAIMILTEKDKLPKK